MIIAVLGILDMIAGGILMFSEWLDLAGSQILFYFTIILFLKALYSIGTAVGAGFYFDIMGWLDLVSSILLLLLYFGVSHGLFFWIGILILIKGIYSFVIAFIAH